MLRFLRFVPHAVLLVDLLICAALLDSRPVSSLPKCSRAARPIAGEAGQEATLIAFRGQVSQDLQRCVGFTCLGKHCTTCINEHFCVCG